MARLYNYRSARNGIVQALPYQTSCGAPCMTMEPVETVEPPATYVRVYDGEFANGDQPMPFRFSVRPTENPGETRIWLDPQSMVYCANGEVVSGYEITIVDANDAPVTISGQASLTLPYATSEQLVTFDPAAVLPFTLTLTPVCP